MISNLRMARAWHGLKKNLRRALDGLGFVEMTTPVRTNGKLRECMELNLRSMLVDDAPGVYEIGPCFRDDVPDKAHLSEFQMLELFWTRPSFGQLTHLTHDLLEVSFGRSLGAFEEIDLAELLPRRYSGFEYGMELDRLRSWAAKYLESKKLASCEHAYEILNALVDQLVDDLTPGTLNRPAMVVNYPTETVCVAKPQDGHPERIQRAEFFIHGLEIAHGFVDDMDPARVERRMAENGPSFVDKPFLELLASGRLPASSGVGFGLDRLLMLAQGIDDIRDCVIGRKTA